MAKILIIEDIIDQAEGLQAYIQSAMGHTVFISLNGHDGFDKAKILKPNLIILDLGLPDMDGFEVCKGVRDDKDIKTTPIIMLTAYTKDNKEVAGFETGADDYIEKPYQIEVLKCRIEALLRRSSSPPFLETKDTCTLKFICEHKDYIHLNGYGFCSESTKSSNPLNLDPNKFAQLGEFLLENKWRAIAKDTGERIYNKIFVKNNEIQEGYTYTKAQTDKFYNLKLCFESNLDFFRVPVEFLFQGEYLALIHPITRKIRGERPRNIPLSPSFFNKLWKDREQLKILLISSNADETKTCLEYADEEILQLKEDIENYLNDREIPFKIEYYLSDNADFESIKNVLEKCSFHIFHYSGHCFYNKNFPGNSYLPFWKERNCKGDVMRLKADTLKLLLHNSNTRFVYLNCCCGGKTSSPENMIDNDIPGMAYSIIQAGVPSALGFRWEVSDKSAANMAKYFYTSLFDQGHPDKALYDARSQIAKNNMDDPTWLSPLLIVQD
jgi:DNA-binding response OmpR family regulator